MSAFVTNNGGAQGLTAVLYGSYIGDGAESRTITIGKTPFAVLVKNPENHSSYGYTNEVSYTPAFAVRGVTGNTLNVAENGFQVTSHGLVNQKNQVYIYIAFC